MAWQLMNALDKYVYIRENKTMENLKCFLWNDKEVFKLVYL